MRAFHLVGDDIVGLEDQITEFLSTGLGRPEVKVRFVVSVGSCLTVWYEEEKTLNPIFNGPLSALYLGVRSYVTLNEPRNPDNSNVVAISTVKQLVEKTAPELLFYRGFGKRSLAEVRQKLAIHGLRLKGDPIPE